MFPLKTRKTCGYGYGAKTFYSAHHLGQDYTAATGRKLFAPFDGEILKQFTGTQGGKTIWFKPKDDNVIMRFMHLSEFKAKVGKVKEGDIIALTGNTGSATTGAHLHIDISKKEVIISDWKNFKDPEKYEWIKQEIAPEITPNPEIVPSTPKPVETPTEPPVNAQSIPVVKETWRDAVLEILTLIRKFFHLL